jgi:hypothetical protein
MASSLDSVIGHLDRSDQHLTDASASIQANLLDHATLQVSEANSELSAANKLVAQSLKPVDITTLAILPKQSAPRRKPKKALKQSTRVALPPEDTATTHLPEKIIVLNLIKAVYKFTPLFVIETETILQTLQVCIIRRPDLTWPSKPITLEKVIKYTMKEFTHTDKGGNTELFVSMSQFVAPMLFPEIELQNLQEGEDSNTIIEKRRIVYNAMSQRIATKHREDFNIEGTSFPDIETWMKHFESCFEDDYYRRQIWEPSLKIVGPPYESIIQQIYLLNDLTLPEAYFDKSASFSDFPFADQNAEGNFVNANHNFKELLDPSMQNILQAPFLGRIDGFLEKNVGFAAWNYSEELRYVIKGTKSLTRFTQKLLFTGDTFSRVLYNFPKQCYLNGYKLEADFFLGLPLVIRYPKDPQNCPFKNEAESKLALGTKELTVPWNNAFDSKNTRTYGKRKVEIPGADYVFHRRRTISYEMFFEVTGLERKELFEYQGKLKQKSLIALMSDVDLTDDQISKVYAAIYSKVLQVQKSKVFLAKALR